MKEMNYRQIQKKLLLENTPFTAILNGHTVECNKPDVRNRHNVYWWIEIDGETVLKKGTASVALNAISTICL